MPFKFKIINKTYTPAGPKKLIGIQIKPQSFAGLSSPRTVRELDYSTPNPNQARFDFIIEINQKDEAVVLKLIEDHKKYFKTFLAPYPHSRISYNKEEIEKFRSKLIERDFDIIIEATSTVEKKQRSTHATLMEPPNIAPSQITPSNEESKTIGPAAPDQEKDEIESLFHYIETLAQCILNKKKLYATYHCVFDKENKFFEQIKLIHNELTSSNNVSPLNQALLNLDFSITQHEINIIRSLIEFLQNKLHVETVTDTKLIELNKKIQGIQEDFNLFSGKTIDKELTAQHKKCVEDISRLNERIRLVFAVFESTKAAVTQSITVVETAIHTQHDVLDENIKNQINKTDFINILTAIKTKDLESAEISFEKIFDKLDNLFNQFTEKKNVARQHLIPACAIAADAETLSADTLLVNTDSLIRIVANFEEKNQAINHKYQDLMHGFTSFFFRKISQKKQTALGEILQTQMNVNEIARLLLTENTSISSQKDSINELKLALNKLHTSIDVNMAILKQYRGLFSGKTSSDQLAWTLKEEACNLEETLAHSLHI